MSEEVKAKAYDTKMLLNKLKDRGLDVAEELAVVLVEEVFDWLAESALLSENKIDDILQVLYPVAKKAALEQVDKIDKEDDEGR